METNYKIIFKLIAIKISAICIILLINGCQKETLQLEPVSVNQFKDFVDATGYQTDAEKYGWSIVQLDVYNYKVVKGANWRIPNGKDNSIGVNPVTQVSYNDAIAYCKWANVRLPSYEEYWSIVKTDKRTIITDNRYPISAVSTSNIVGNVWDITEPINPPKIRLAGGSLFCSEDTCHGTQKDRVLFVDPETGNLHIGFSVIKE